jgi:HEAT repeat protein
MVRGALLRALDHDDHRLVATAIAGLLRHGPVTQDFVARFGALLEHGSADVRAAALGSIERVVHDPRVRNSLVRRALSDPSPEVRRAALAAVVALGPGSEVLADRVVELFRSEAEALKPWALEALSQVCAESAGVVAALLDNPFVYQARGQSTQSVLERLLRVHPRLVPALETWIESRDPRLVTMGLAIARELGPCAKPPLSAAIARMAGTRASRNHEALWTLHAVDHDAWVELEVHHYLDPEAQRDSDCQPQPTLLRRWGPAALPPLQRALTNADPRIVAAACGALVDFGPPARAAAGELTRLLDQGPAELREHAVQALAHVAPTEGIPVFARLLRSADRAARIHGLRGLTRLRSGYAHLVTDLLARIGDPEEGALGLVAVRNLGPEAHRAVPFLVRVLEDPARHVPPARADGVRQAVVGILGAIGPKAKAAALRLAALVEQGDAAALIALTRVDPDDERLPEVLARHLCGADPALALAAAQCLTILGPARLPSAALRAALRTKDQQLLGTVLAALRGSSVAARSLVPELVRVAVVEPGGGHWSPEIHAVALLAEVAPHALSDVALGCPVHRLSAIASALEQAREVPVGLVRVIEQRAVSAAPDEVDMFVAALARVSPGHDLVVDHLRLRRLWRGKDREPAGHALRGDRVRPENANSLASVLLELDRDAAPRHHGFPSFRGSHFEVVAKMGPPAVPVLVALGSHPDPRARLQSALLLGRIGHRSPEAFASVRAALRDRDAAVRGAAWSVLMEVATSDEEAIRCVLDDGLEWHGGLHGPAIACLARIGPGARTALPALRQAIEVGWPEAVRAFLAVGEPDPATIQTLLQAAESDDGRMRFAALWALGDLGPLAAPAVPVLVRALMDRDQAVRHAALRSLGRIGPAARSARATVGWFARHGALRWREIAQETLGAIDPPAASHR